MNTFQRILTAVLFSTAALSAAQAAQTDYGQPAASAFASRVIDIDAGTRYVNVQNGETVQFNIQGQSFIWHFDTYPNKSVFALQKIAPAGVNAGAVEVYVASNPLYRG